jgi:cytochrome c553
MKKEVLTFTVLLFCSCVNNKKDKIEPVVPPVVGSVSYVDDVQPIINAYCVSCHPANNPGTKLETYPQLKSKADDGTLVGTINHEPNFRPMPENGMKLSNSQIQNITNWVNQGAPNN